MKTMCYLVYRERSADRLWLADDEKTWTASISDAAQFNDATLAYDVGLREAGLAGIYVLSLMV